MWVMAVLLFLAILLAIANFTREETTGMGGCLLYFFAAIIIIFFMGSCVRMII